MRAIWQGTTIAESDNTIIVEGNHYFPRESLSEEFFSPNAKTSSCFWKGTASYLDITVKGETNAAAAWTYPEPKTKAAHIRDHVAFWNGVEVVD